MRVAAIVPPVRTAPPAHASPSAAPAAKAAAATATRSRVMAAAIRPATASLAEQRAAAPASMAVRIMGALTTKRPAMKAAGTKALGMKAPGMRDVGTMVRDTTPPATALTRRKVPSGSTATTPSPPHWRIPPAACAACC